MMASSAGMRDLGQRLLIGLGAAAAAVMAIGYAFIAGNVAAPLGRDLGTFAVPTPGDAEPVLLEDGRPAFLVNLTGGPVVAVDARAPVGAGEPGRLVGWCGAAHFLEAVSGATYAADGSRFSATEPGPGLVVHATRPADRDRDRVTVVSDGRPAGTRDDMTAPIACQGAVAHEARAGEAFDPSVAAEEEPPGWIWLEGALVARAGEVMLCDGEGAACQTGGPVGGIDPAKVPVPAWTGHFLGRVRDGTIVDLQFVPHPGGNP